MNATFNHLIALSFSCVLMSKLAGAADIDATVSDEVIVVGQTTAVEIYLDLDVGEDASLFEGHFNISNLGTLAGVELSPGGPTWDSSVGNVQDSQAIVSLTSNNEGGDRLVASLAVTGIAAGQIDISVGSPAPFAAYDISSPPFTESLTIGTAIGSVLASVTVTSGGLDSDGDGVLDSVDNCTLASNASQLDVDGDGFGNACDADFNNDCIVNFVDISTFSTEFLGSNPLFDINGDGAVNFVDFTTVSQQFLQSPGPGLGVCD